MRRRPSQPQSLLWQSFVALACVCLVTACEGPAPRSATAPQNAQQPAAPPPRVVVLGLDAGDWTLLDPWIEQGKLPNLARLRAGGVYGKLRSTVPSSSPVIWTSIATGKVPDKTGITWFVRFPQGPGKPVPVDRRQRKTSALWNMLSDRRTDVAVLGWYVTWPAEEVSGRLLSDLAHFGRVEQSRFPASFLWDLKPVSQTEAVAAMPQFMTWNYDPAKAVRKEGEPPSLDYLVYDRFVRAWTRDRFYLDAAERTLKDGPLPEALFLYLRGTDDVQHGFWKFMEPQAFEPRAAADGKPLPGAVEVPAEHVAAFGKVIEHYWQWVDESVGKLLSHYRDEPPLVIVCSDHGAGPAVGADMVEVPEYLHLSGSHRIDGFFIANGPGIRSGSGGKGIEISDATIYDVAPTLLHALGLPMGKDMDGKILTQVFEDAVAQRTIAPVDSWDTGRSALPAEGEVPAEVDEKVLEHLRSLGYIGGN